jgi:hypothetical protein
MRVWKIKIMMSIARQVKFGFAAAPTWITEGNPPISVQGSEHKPKALTDEGESVAGCDPESGTILYLSGFYPLNLLL